MALTRGEYLRLQAEKDKARNGGRAVMHNARNGRKAVTQAIHSRRVLAGVGSDARHRNHGSRTEYVHGCRCVECRAAQAAYDQERYRAKQTPELIAEYEASPLSKELSLGQYKRRMTTGEYRKAAHKVDTRLTHGTYSCYRNAKCRCDDCRHAASAHRKQWRAAKEDQQWREGDQWRE